MTYLQFQEVFSDIGKAWDTEVRNGPAAQQAIREIKHKLSISSGLITSKERKEVIEELIDVSTQLMQPKEEIPGSSDYEDTECKVATSISKRKRLKRSTSSESLSNCTLLPTTPHIQPSLPNAAHFQQTPSPGKTSSAKKTRSAPSMSAVCSPPCSPPPSSSAVASSAPRFSSTALQAPAKPPSSAQRPTKAVFPLFFPLSHPQTAISSSSAPRPASPNGPAKPSVVSAPRSSPRAATRRAFSSSTNSTRSRSIAARPTTLARADSSASCSFSSARCRGTIT